MNQERSNWLSEALKHPLFTKRKKAIEESSARALGEYTDVLVSDAPKEFRFQVIYALRSASQRVNFFFDLMEAIQGYLSEEYGRANLCGINNLEQHEDLHGFIVEKSTTLELMDVISATIFVLEETVFSYSSSSVSREACLGFVSTIKIRLREHKLAYDLIDNQIVGKDSNYLHQEVVIPAVSLLHNRPRFKAAEEQYRAAFEELSRGKWADSVTDANASVELVLREILGYKEGQLPGLLGDARKMGIFGSPQEARLKRLVNGLEALSDMRNKESDAHGNKADRETAWLAVHWAGALIVFLVERAEAIGK